MPNVNYDLFDDAGTRLAFGKIGSVHILFSRDDAVLWLAPEKRIGLVGPKTSANVPTNIIIRDLTAELNLFVNPKRATFIGNQEVHGSYLQMKGPVPDIIADILR